MASGKDYLQFILEQLSGLDEITYRPMMVDNVDNKDFLMGLFNAMYDDLPTPKSKKRTLVGRKVFTRQMILYEKSLMKGELYTLSDEDNICACVILNSEQNEGYESCQWTIDCDLVRLCPRMPLP